MREINSVGKAIEEIEELFLKEKGEKLYKFLVSSIEKPLIGRILQNTKGNQLKAASILGINRNTLRSKIKKLGIQIEQYRKG
ncbi:MAG: helix-turn-helix domain-containing protein [bacterium]